MTYMLDTNACIHYLNHPGFSYPAPNGASAAC